jgi:hypothetical protein
MLIRTSLQGFRFWQRLPTAIAGGDSGVFFNDTRKVTTAQEFMCLAQSSKLTKSQHEDLQAIGRYHSWTWDKHEFTRECIKEIGTKLIGEDDPDGLERVFTKAIEELEIECLRELEALAMSMVLSRDIIGNLARGGDWASISSHDICAGIYNGFFGNECFTNIVSVVANRLTSAADEDEFKLIAAVLVLTDENWYVVPGFRGLKLYYSQLGLVFEFPCSVCKGSLVCTKFKVTDIVPFCTESYLAASIALFYTFCVSNSAFSDLFHNRRADLSLKCGASLTTPFGRDMSPRTACEYTALNFRGMLKAVVTTVRHMAGLKITERNNCIPPTSDGIITKEFGNDSIGGSGSNRLTSFPCNMHGKLDEEPVPLWFMEVYTLPGEDWRKLYRCRFIVALPKSLFLDTIKQLQHCGQVTGYVYYTDSHYGQDVYAAGKMDPKKPKEYFIPDVLLNESEEGNYGWMNSSSITDYATTTIGLCSKKEFFPFEYVGSMQFNISNGDVTFDGDVADIPDLREY